MSTRACYTFRDKESAYSVYYHYDGYPSNALKMISKAKEAAWQFPRFEADEYAAAFCYTAKDGKAGGARLTAGPHRHGDLSYRYDVWFQDNDLMVKIWEVDFHNEKLLDKGNIYEMWSKYVARKE
jgi:hypothetical protein|tara:strand:- start:28 stop:402 length:375 start_codon:yes stop_codon:yes gene_type:complete